ncbi:MAG TPA: hypothetical protein VFI23_15120 [Rhizomicrobium sp.]|nr:hypothetical protein [Rhizomicrobium sp.]
MNSIYFAISCILMVAVIFWGSTEKENEKLGRFFGPRSRPTSESDKLEAPSRKKGQR